MNGDFPARFSVVTWRWLVYATLGFGLLLSRVALPLAWAEPAGGMADALADAELADIFFLDPEHGWAVGDRGAIWSTSDGGRKWRQRESPTGCRWESVWFADSQHGWIVGGWYQPATGQSRGAVLRTRDGGQNWMPVPASTLPRLLKVRFEDSQRGWAVGEPSPLYPTGVFRSEDGGRSWAPLPGPTSGSWLTGDWPAKTGLKRLGVVAGLQGRIAHLTADGLAPQIIPAARGRAIRAITLAPFNTSARSSVNLRAGERSAATFTDDNGPSWLVGDEGLVLCSDDGGRSWHEPPTQPPPVCAQFTWNSLAVQDGRVWIAGDPGNVVLHSADHGVSWQLLPTSETAPLRGIHFFDRQRGWAVGALGQILATRDGGQSWKRIQGHGRVAMLGLFSDESRLPLELFAQTAGNDGYLSIAELIFARQWPPSTGPSNDSGSPIASAPSSDSALSSAAAPSSDSAPSSAAALSSNFGASNHSKPSIASDSVWHARGHSRAARVHAALLEVGASGGGASERFPVEDRGLEPTAERLIAAWNERHDGRGFERLVEQLTIRLRTWRPEVVVTEDAVGDGVDVLTSITRQAVLSAVQRAADPRALSEPAEACGLATWQVKKVYGQVVANDRGGVSLNAMQLSPRLARPIGDIAARGRWQLEETPRPPPPSLTFRLILNSEGLTPSRRDVMEGIVLPAGADGRRELSPINTRSDVADLARIAQRQRTLQQLMLRGDSSVPPTGAVASTPIGASPANPVAATSSSGTRSGSSLLGGIASSAWLTQLDTLAQGAGNQGAGELYWQLGQRLHEAGQSTIALETWALLATRLPHHELADAALVRLLEQLASGEQRHRGELAARERLAQAAQSAGIAFAPAVAPAVSPGVAQIGEDPLDPSASGRSKTVELAIGVAVGDPAGDAGLGESRGPGSGVRYGAGNGVERGTNRAARAARAATPRVVAPATFETQGRMLDETRVPGEKFAKILEQTRPALFADPALRLVWLAALRAGGRRADVETLLRNSARPQWPEASAKALADEWWLLQADDRPGGKPPRLTVDCPLAATRPRLDGRLDDALWASAAVCPLQATPALVPSHAGTATARIARDREFLYLSATCQRLARQPNATTVDSGPRPRDAALEGRDRVEFLFDVDRDYRTAFRLVCDERGWTFESSAEDASWNPTWYVAAAQDDDMWTVEAAISWAELARSPPLSGAVWALGIQRIAPGHGGQSWTGAPISTIASGPTAIPSRRTQTDSSPAAFGWIRFE